jgi:hypothetical protein
MKSDIANIAEKALGLSPPGRAYIAEILLESLDFEEDFPISEEWISEIQKRCHEIDNGSVKLISGEAGLSNLREEYL